MRATELLAVHQLTIADIVQLGNDPRFFNVTAIACSSETRDGRCEVSLRSFDGLQGIRLVRTALESLLIVPRAPAPLD